MKKISVVISVYNEAGNILPLVERIHTALLGYDYEIIYVDDGSKDETVSEIRSLNDPSIRLVEFNINYGQSSALAAGIDLAQGDYIVLMDGDLQNDPKDIPGMLKFLEERDLDMVAGIRINRKDGWLLRKTPSQIANFLIRHATGIRLKDYGCALKLFRSDLAKSLQLYGELHRFIPVLAVLEGGRIDQVPVRHHPRIHGKSKYGLGRIFRVMSDLFLMVFMKRYFQRPIHLFGTTGWLLTFAGIGINIYLLVLKLVGQDIAGKSLVFLGILLLIGGIQLLTIGIISEILIRTYYTSRKAKPYRIRRIWDFPEPSTQELSVGSENSE